VESQTQWPPSQYSPVPHSIPIGPQLQTPASVQVSLRVSQVTQAAPPIPQFAIKLALQVLPAQQPDAHDNTQP
jgi:hypothetical protein